jgi:SH3-like domain-containing protein
MARRRLNHRLQRSASIFQPNGGGKLIGKRSAPVIVILLLFMNGTALAERMTVNVSMANVRSGPGKKHSILWKLEKYHPVDVLRKQDPWYYFQDFENDKGWIHKSLLGNDASVIVVKDRCNVRSGPGTQHDVVFTVEKGVPFKVLKKEGEWIRIVHADGDKGWIHRNLVW